MRETPCRTQDNGGKNDTNGWRWVGTATPDSADRLKIPTELREVGMFDTFDQAEWGCETSTGAMVIAPDELAVAQ